MMASNDCLAFGHRRLAILHRRPQYHGTFVATDNLQLGRYVKPVIYESPRE